MKAIILALGLLASVSFGAPKYTSIDKVVAVATTRVALSATQLYSSHVLIKAKAGNGGLIYVGGDDVAAANGYELAAGEEILIGNLAKYNANEALDLATVYIDAATNGDGVRVLYVYDRYKSGREPDQ